MKAALTFHVLIILGFTVAICVSIFVQLWSATPDYSNVAAHSDTSRVGPRPFGRLSTLERLDTP